MITKFLLVVWIGAGQTQTLDITPFDTLAECEAAKNAVYAVTDRDQKWHRCVPYTFDPTMK